MDHIYHNLQLPSVWNSIGNYFLTIVVLLPLSHAPLPPSTKMSSEQDELDLCFCPQLMHLHQNKMNWVLMDWSNSTSQSK